MNTAPRPAPPSYQDERIINPLTTMDAVTLRVGDLEKLSEFYASSISLEPIEERTRGREIHRVLGRGAVPMVRLIHTPGLPVSRRHSAGLFHTAFLFDDAQSLASTVYRASRHPLSQFVGSSDHGVSEAFYFTDPEGNGIELYVDRPRNQWQYHGSQIAMKSDWLDPNDYLTRHVTEASLNAGPAQVGRVGHVHLQVGDLALARSFYVDAVGFEATLDEYPGALFASAGGYHHHVAMNTWNSAGSGPRAASLGLGNVAITVPSRADLDVLAVRLAAKNLQFADDGRTISVDAPWGTNVTIALPDSSVDELLAR